MGMVRMSRMNSKNKRRSENKEIEKLLTKPSVKAIVLAIFTIIIGLGTSYIVSWKCDYLHFIVGIILILLILLYLSLLGYYATKETNIHKEKETLEKQNKAFATTMSNLTSSFKTNAALINNYSKYFEGAISYDSVMKFNLDSVASSLCHDIYDIICRIAELGEDFSVSYTKTIEYGDNTVKKVKMIAYNNDGNRQPNVFDDVRSVIDNEDAYLDLRLFKKANPDPKILKTLEEVQKEFHYKNGTDRDKYVQYIGVPVFCDGHKMDGLLQVTVMKGSILKEQERDLIFVARKYLIPYSNLFLFFSKIDKLLKLQKAYMEVQNEKKAEKD